MPTIKISKSTVDGLLPSETTTLWLDVELKGFGIRVTPKGKKVYVVQYRMPGKRKTNTYTIGSHGSPWTPTLARKEAAAKLLQISQGTDPNAEKRRKRNETVDYGFEAYADRFSEMYLRKNWVGSYDRAVSVLRRHAKPFFKTTDIREITKRDCTLFVESLSHMGATARKAVEVVGKMFGWAMDRGDLDSNPMAKTPRPKPSAGRERVLDDDELRRVWNGAEKMDHPYGRLVQMLALMGQRRGEVGGMRWDELDFDRLVWEVPRDRTKSGRGNIVPLTPLMIEIVRNMPRLGDLVFSVSGDNELGNHSKLKLRLDAIIGEAGLNTDTPVEPWTLHDLRRTAATGLQRLGVLSDLVEVTQGRTKKLGAGQAYQRYDYLEEKREALGLWDTHVRELVE